jgi:uncharacterized protein
MPIVIILLIVGLLAGILSGLVGIGGGIIIVPALVYFMQFSQHQAQGTVLFMFLLPVSALGVMTYYKEGYVDIKTSLIIAVTFVFGSLIGSKLAISFDQAAVKKIFAVVMLIMALKMLFNK